VIRSWRTDGMSLGHGDPGYHPQVASHFLPHEAVMVLAFVSCGVTPAAVTEMVGLMAP